MPAEQTAYDVFLSFNSEDRGAVRKIAEYLADVANLRPWFDEWVIIPGERWMQTLQRGLGASATCAVFVGKNGEGPWQGREVENALKKQTENPSFRVIPVLLPDAPQKPELPLFLEGNMWVEFDRSLDDDDALWRLECGIRGTPPGRCRPEARALPWQKLFLNQLHSFDLGELVKAFKNHLWSRQGLVGVAVHYPSHQFLDVFCDRLVNEYRTRKMKRYEKPLEIQPLCMPVELVMKTIKQHENILQRYDMIFGVKSDYSHLAEECWQKLCQDFPADSLSHRLIVVFAVPHECSFPKDVFVLDSPSFSVADVDTWVNNFVEKFSWREATEDMAVMADCWTDAIIRECQLENEATLHIESVYHHLDSMIRVLQQQKPTMAMFVQALQARSGLCA